MSDQTYPGEELELFTRAANWKRYLVSHIAPFVGGRVLEVGAGIGGFTRAAIGVPCDSWVCLERDPENAQRIADLIARGELPPRCVARQGTIGDLDRTATFDSILYIDVLEHIDDDVAEMREAAELLAIGGHLVVMSPAHPWLYSPFDAAIGHHRRYVKRTLRGVVPPRLALVCLRYLDSVGLLASAANRAILKQSTPSLREIQFWDWVMVRSSTWLDPVLRYRIGKSVLGVWGRFR